MKFSIGTAFGCAHWLQMKLGYSRWECGRVSRLVHVNLCAGGPECVDVD